MRRAAISLKKKAAMTVTRVSLGAEKLVYVLVADRALKYALGRSRIAYIGTTKKGVSRVSQSVATRANAILSLHGVKAFDARIVTCKPRRHVKTWLRLERALLVEFRGQFGELPKCNTKGNIMTEDGVFDLFSKTRVSNILKTLSA